MGTHGVGELELLCGVLPRPDDGDGDAVGADAVGGSDGVEPSLNMFPMSDPHSPGLSGVVVAGAATGAAGAVCSLAACGLARNSSISFTTFVSSLDAAICLGVSPSLLQASASAPFRRPKTGAESATGN